MSRPKFHVQKGDEVTVISGNHRNATGKVLQVLPKKSQVLIEGVRLIKKTMRKSQDHPNGALITREGPIHVSNVRLVEVKTEKTASKPAKKEPAPRRKSKKEKGS